MFDHDIFLSHAAKDGERVDEVREALIRAKYRVYCDRHDDKDYDHSKVDKETAELLRQRMRRCKMLLFVVTANSRESAWMPWELGFFDAARGKIVVYPVDEAAERTARRQEYLALYDIVAPGSIEAAVAARIGDAEPLPAAVAAMEALRRNAVDNIFGAGDFGASREYGGRIAGVTHNPLDFQGLMQLQADLVAASWQVWFGMFSGRR